MLVNNTMRVFNKLETFVISQKYVRNLILYFKNI